MPITILCPNNHKLTCPDSLAGKAGKCPHCGAKFKIPGPATAEVAAAVPTVAVVTASPAAKPAAASAPASAPEPEPEQPKSPIRAYEEDGAAPGDDEIVFLCPEGHHLCGPATLAGETGECPTCHVKFIVPSPDEAVAEEPEISLSSVLATADAPQGFSFSGGEDGQPRGLGALFAQLWKFRALGCAVELHLGEGRVMVPNGFAPESAALSHGLFTVSEPNGAATVSVIAWSAIERINVRGMQSLPRGIEFDVP